MHYTLHCTERLKKIVSSHLFPVCNRSNLTTRNFDILRDLSLPANVSQSGDYDVMSPDPRRGLTELRSGVKRSCDITAQSRNLRLYQNLLGSMNEIGFRESFGLLVGWKSSIITIKITFDQEVGRRQVQRVGKWRLARGEIQMRIWYQSEAWINIRIDAGWSAELRVFTSVRRKQKIILESDICYGTGCE